MVFLYSSNPGGLQLSRRMGDCIWKMSIELQAGLLEIIPLISQGGAVKIALLSFYA